ncbi:DUF1622 domain-containing protein [Butyrivibrio sp. XB500-5]|uniref:DUF1622 domain-containing protein n=1 Tax=Butyrivibrio sp. XB500-5 TaxID=2364880 RepID=UPI000EAA231F|nr:DUF1622 domain-containing protein [Butyrivibrio sp. XB500-5]RKM60791.1 DUF1622 domain-containing protein [Butyrivibrio sp. XB500-5]
METIYSNAEYILRYVVEYSTLLLEFFGICILVFTAVKCFIFWLKKDESIRLQLAQGIALALEFKLGGEVLRTVVVREWAELGILGAIILLRATLTFLIHWEIKNEKEALEPGDKKEAPEPGEKKE